MSEYQASYFTDKRENTMMMQEMRVGRYCIVDYDEHLVALMRQLARHVYSVGEYQGERVIYDFDHNPIPKKIMVTDMRIALTSSQDRMRWSTVMKDMLFIKDKTILR